MDRVVDPAIMVARVALVGAATQVAAYRNERPDNSRPGQWRVLKHPAILWGLVAVQTTCGAYFLWEILASILGLPTLPLRWQMRELVEIGTSIGLIIGALLGIALALVSGREMQRAENARRVTSGEFTGLVDDYFAALALTPAETEIAWFLLKGMSAAEIARLRATAEGTVKTQCTAIYRKAGVNSKSQLFSLLVEDVLL